MLKKLTKMSKQVMTVLLTVILIVSVVPFSAFASENSDFAGGSGTAEDPYLISTEEQLNKVRNYMSSYFKMINDIEMINCWVPIGNSNNKFTGNFDGAGFKIANLNISGSYEDVGLFAYNSGIIENLGIISGSFELSVVKSSSSGAIGANIQVGAISGTNVGSVKKCFGNVNINAYASATTTTGAYAIISMGGVVGYNKGLIENCYNVGTLNGEAFARNTQTNGYKGAQIYGGGICGQQNWGGEIRLCYNIGKLSASYTTQGGYSNNLSESYIAGIVGSNLEDRDKSNLVENCYYLNNLSQGVGKYDYHEEETICCTTEQMQERSCYEEFDFEEIWEIDNFNKYFYPQLRSCRQETVSQISIIEKPDKISIVERKDAEIDGMLVNIVYDDGCSVTKTASTSMIKNFKQKSVGTQILSLCYGDAECLFEAEVIQRSLIKIEILELPTNTEPLENQEIDLSGGMVTLYYDNGEQELISLTETEIYGYDKNIVGMQKVTVRYKGKECYFDVCVVAKSLISVEIYNLPDKTEYLEAKDALDLEGGQIKLNYDNGTFEILDMELDNAYGFDNSVVGFQTISVVHNEFTVCFDIEIIARSIDYIKLTTYPHKNKYNEGSENLDLSGGIITIYYNNDTTEDVVLSSKMVTGFDSTKIGKQTLTVNYDGFTTTFDIEIMVLPENTSEFAGGKGLKYSPYLVSTKEHLNNVRNYPNACFKQINDIVFYESDFKEDGEYYNGGYGWMPIGKNETLIFTGVYEGDGYTIEGIKTNITTVNTIAAGLFGYCSGTIKNIKIKNAIISVNVTSDDCESYVGSIVGYLTGSVIGCENINSTVSGDHTGGIAGYAYYPDIISGCANSGLVKGICIGGIVGKIVVTGKSYSGADPEIVNCTNTADLSDGSFIGGIVGKQDSGVLVIENCINYGNIHTQSPDRFAGPVISGNTIVNLSYCSGGIVGYSSAAELNECINIADIHGDCAGGMIGFGAIDIYECTNKGKISGKNFIGGLVGYCFSGSVRMSQNYGKISGIQYIDFFNNNVPTDYAGGIVGYTKSQSVIYTSYNSGMVDGAYYNGGIAGCGYVISICYNTGVITSNNYSAGICAELINSSDVSVYDCFNIGEISGKYAAGVVSKMSTGSVSTVYNTGEIIVSQSGGYKGAIVAYITNGTVKDSYYLDNISYGIGYTDYAIATVPKTVKLTEEQMSSKDSFQNFDFVQIWTMDGNADYKFPKFNYIDMVYISYTSGDINDDGDINNRDYALLMQYLNKWDVTINEDAADVNRDDTINNRDYALLMQYLNKWDIELQ